jgi:hypothetical protein
MANGLRRADAVAWLSPRKFEKSQKSLISSLRKKDQTRRRREKRGSLECVDGDRTANAACAVCREFCVNTRTSGPGFGKPTEQDGFGDTTVRLKINFLGNDGGKLVIGFVLSLKILTNTDHTGNHVGNPGLVYR